MLNQKNQAKCTTTPRSLIEGTKIKKENTNLNDFFLTRGKELIRILIILKFTRTRMHTHTFSR